MNRTEILNELASIQALLVALVENLDDASYRQQHHVDLSPIGWHLGHSVTIERFWLENIMLGKDTVDDDQQYLYFPENMPKPERGGHLPPIKEHIEWARQQQQKTMAFLSAPPQDYLQHKFATDHYMEYFLLQHHCQHAETMHMVLTQRRFNQRNHYAPQNELVSKEPQRNSVSLPAGDFTIGSDVSAIAYDNEVPPQRVQLHAGAIAPTPVSNAEYLCFIQENGYKERSYWSDEGWAWREESGVSAPDSWQAHDGQWFIVEAQGCCDLPANASVYGINHFEAEAFVNWLRATRADDFADVRLPHEYEWEVAAQLNMLDDIGKVWEWCANTFHPYPDYRAFPYDRYSSTWFDGSHYSLRGASRYTQAVIKRNSFRNFYEADKRHIFAGLRLAYGEPSVQHAP